MRNKIIVSHPEYFHCHQFIVQHGFRDPIPLDSCTNDIGSNSCIFKQFFRLISKREKIQAPVKSTQIETIMIPPVFGWKLNFTCKQII